MRAILLLFALAVCGSAAYAAPGCGPAEPRKPGDQILDWYDTYVRPFRTVSAPASPDKGQVEALVEAMTTFHRRALDPLFFEALTQQIVSSYAGSPDFRGIDASVAGKIYKAGTGTSVDFSLLCIEAKSVRSPDDAFAITLFGVTADDCRHVGLRGLVFTDTWVNGSANGQCRPDHTYYRMWVVPVAAGTNSVTFVCRKEPGGCSR